MRKPPRAKKVTARVTVRSAPMLEGYYGCGAKSGASPLTLRASTIAPRRPLKNTGLNAECRSQNSEFRDLL
jgi:hypothetical protein